MARRLWVQSMHSCYGQCNKVRARGPRWNGRVVCNQKGQGLTHSNSGRWELPIIQQQQKLCIYTNQKKQKTLSPHLLQWQKLTCSATKMHKLTVRPQLSARPTCDVPLENKRHLEWWSSSATETLRNYLETDFSAAYGSILQYSLIFFLRINDL